MKHVLEISEMSTEFLSRTLKERDILEDLGIGGRITLEWIQINMREGRELYSFSLGMVSVMDSCEYDSEYLDYVNGGEFLEE